MELSQYLTPLRRWWWLLLVTAMVTGASSFFAVRRLPLVYETHVTLLVGRSLADPNPNSGDLGLTQQLALSYAELVKRQPVQNAVLAALRLSRLPDYKVRVVPNTQLVEISVTDIIPGRAQAVANELAKQLMLQSPTGSATDSQQRQAFINQQLDDLQNQIKTSQADIAKKQSDLANMFSASQIADTQTQIGALQTKLTQLQANYATMLSTSKQGAINTLSIVEAAALPDRPIGPPKVLLMALAGVAGLVLAGGASYLLEYLDDTLKNPAQVLKSLDLITLGAVPAGKEFRRNHLAMLDDERTAVTEAYRVLRSNVQFAAADHKFHTLLITSPGMGEGKSVTSANLAVALAKASARVILVDADLNRPRVHRLFDLPNEIGLSSILQGQPVELAAALHREVVPNLTVLTAGPLPDNPGEMLSSPRVPALIHTLREMADFVIVDSPPVSAVADTVVLSRYVEGTIMVLDATKTRRVLADRSAAALRQAKAHLLGAVLNRLPKGGSAGYFYYVQYDPRYVAEGGRTAKHEAKRQPRR